MIRHSLLPALLVLITGALFVGGCDSSGQQTGPVEGTLTLRLTGASASLDSAVVTVDRATLMGRTDDGEDVAVPLSEEPRTLDLLRLQDGAMAILADRVGVVEGTYTELRLTIGGTNYVVVDGEKVPLSLPSDTQPRPRVVLPELSIETDEDRLDLTLDFDVEDSVRQPASGEYQLDPAVRLEALSVNGRSVPTVSVKGRVTSVDADSGRVAVDNLPFSTTDRTVFDGAGGGASLAGLSEGQALEVEATILEGGRLRAREIEGTEGATRSITAFVESKQDGRFQILGVPVRVSSNTAFDVGGLGDLSVGDRVEVEYEFVNGTRTALAVETEFL
ncbi:MAG: DUF5666 domain-containing protein [Salinibacter sp.]